MDGETKFPVLKLGKSSKSSKSKCWWPNPEASTGEHYKNANLGRNQCWEAIGEVRQKFEGIASEIKIHLEKCSDPVAHPVIWTIYMIGRTREESVPTIMFCGRDKNARTGVKETVNESGILNKHPGIRTGSCSEEFRHYTMDEDSDPECLGVPVEAGQAILFSLSYVGNGMQILFQGFHGSTSSLRPATGGGFIYSSSSCFLMTVAHALDKTAEEVLSSPADSYNFEFELDDFSDIDNEDIEMSSRGSVSPESSDSDDSPISMSGSSDSSSEFGERSRKATNEERSADKPEFIPSTFVVRKRKKEPSLLLKSDVQLHSLGDHIISSKSGPRPGLDYCLIEIKKNSLQKSNKICASSDESSLCLFPRRIVTSGPKDVDVVAAIGSGGLMRGRLSGTPSFLMLPDSTSVQEVWTMRHDSSLVNGDCGSWVVDASNGELFGHIVGGSPKSGVTYIIPAFSVFDDLKERYGVEWSLSIAANTTCQEPLQSVAKDQQKLIQDTKTGYEDLIQSRQVEKLKENLGSTESSIYKLRRLLQLCEKNARSDIGVEVIATRDTLVQAKRRFEQIASEVKSFVRLIEYHEPSKVDLNLQVTQLNKNISTILGDLEAAESKASEAMRQLMSYEISVNDIHQEIEAREHELKEEEGSERRQLASMAESQLKQSTKLVEEAENTAIQKTKEIDQKTTEVTNLRSKLLGYQRSLRQKKQDTAEARSMAKKKAFVGGGVALLGIGLAPFTMGLSLVMTGALAGATAGIATDYNDMKNETSFIQFNISTINREIREAESSLIRLIWEKDVLEYRIADLQSKIMTRKPLQNIQNQITDASRILSDVSTVESHADLLCSTLHDFTTELKRTKEIVDNCAAVLNGQTVQLQVEASFIDKRFARSREMLRCS